jgi:hypothetical protein
MRRMDRINTFIQIQSATLAILSVSLFVIF